jgi:FkbM family methyltransferase
MPINHRALTRYGHMFYDFFDNSIGFGIATYGEWYQSELDLVQPYVSTGGVCIDAGANIGAHTLSFAKTVGPAGQVIAIEPQLLIFEYLNGNAAINGFQNIFTYHAGAREKEGIGKMPIINYEKWDNFSKYRISDERELQDSISTFESIKIITIDSLELKKVDLLKISVRGEELKILEGSRKTIVRCQPFLYMGFDGNAAASDVLSLIKSYGYIAYEHYAQCFNPDNFKKINENTLLKQGKTNLFCIPPNKKITLNLNRL